MPAYSRFLDLQIASKSHYDWKEEIVENCKYQRETKQANNVQGKALIALPYLDKVEITVAAILKRLANVEIALYLNPNDDMAELITLLRDLAPSVNIKKFVLGAGLSRSTGLGMKARLRDTAIELLSEAPVGQPAILVSKPEKIFVLQKLPLAPNPDIVVIDRFSSPDIDVLATDPTIGYVSATVNMSDIQSGAQSAYAGNLVKWITGGGRAKIRITCHGDGEGYLEMKDPSSTLHSVRADAIGEWLFANGLTRKGNLEVINVNICMGAKCNITPAVLKSGVYSAADGSAVALLAESLGKHGVHGIRITGANEVIAGVEAKEVDTLTPVSGPRLQAGQGVRKIGIPTGFGFAAASLTMTVKFDWKIAKTARGESQLFTLTPPTLTPPDKWSVEKGKSSFKRPVEAASSSFTFTDTKNTVIIPSEGWIVDGNSVLSAEGWTQSGPNDLKFIGTGGATALETKVGDDGKTTQYTILERLAKSKAKAVATS